MRRSPTDNRRAERKEWEAAATAVEIGLSAARAMRRAGKLSNRDLEVLERAAKHEHLHSPQLPTEEYVKLRRSGQYDEMAKDAELSSDEVAAAELACRKVATWFHAESAQQGHMTAKEAREALAGHVVIPDADKLDDEAFVARASTLANDPLAKLDKAERVPGWGKEDEPVTSDDEREFLSRQAGTSGVDTPAMRRAREDAKDDPNHPFAVAGRVEPLEAEEPTDA